MARLLRTAIVCLAAAESVASAQAVKTALEWDGVSTYYFGADGTYRHHKKGVGFTEEKNVAGNWGCIESTVDAAVHFGQRKIHLFSGSEYARYDMDENACDEGYPKPIAGNWTGLPWDSDLDAAVAYNGKAYFFKGSQYVRFDIAANRADLRARSIEAGWPGVWTDGVDAAVNTGQGKVLFFKGNEVISYDIATEKADGSPRPIEDVLGGTGTGGAGEPTDVTTLTLARWKDLVEAEAVTGFAVQTYGDDGAEEPLVWEDDAATVKEFVGGFRNSDAVANARVSAAARLPAFVRTSDGKVFGMTLVGDAKWLGCVLIDGYVPVDPISNDAIKRALKDLEFEVGKVYRKKKRDAAAAAGETSIPFHEPADVDATEQYDVILYRDFDGEKWLGSWARAYATARTDRKIIVAEATSPASVIKALNNKAEGSCVKNLAIVAHGGDGEMALGSHPVNTNWVGLMPSRPAAMTPKTFGRGIKASLCQDARVVLAVCGAVAGKHGKNGLTDLAAASGASVYGSAYAVVFREDKPVPRVWTDELWVAFPGRAGAAKVFKPTLDDISVVP